MHRFLTLTLTLCASSLLLLAIAFSARSAQPQTTAPVSPWQWGTASIKVGECKDRADKFLEGKGFVVTKVTSQGGANKTDANAEASSQEFFVLVDCVANGRTSTSSRILVVVVGRTAAAQVAQLRQDVMKAVMK
jgi:hypothetical protein